MRNRLTSWMFGAAFAAIPVLALVQYRWIERVSDADFQRESSRLKRGLEQVAAGLDAEIARAHLWFALRPDELGPEQASISADSVAEVYARRMAEWRSSTEFPDVVKEIRFVFDEEGRLVGRDGKFTESAPPPDPRKLGLQGRRGASVIDFEGQIGTLMPVIRGAGLPGEGRLGRMTFGLPRPPRGPGPPEGFGGPPPDRDEGRPEPPRHRGERMLVFDAPYIISRVVPTLADRFLGHGSYELQIAAADRVLSGPATIHDGLTVRALTMRPECVLPADDLDPQSARRDRPWTGQRSVLLRQPAQSCGSIPADSSAGLWKVSAATALEASAGAFRARNLALSAGVLLCLAGAIVALWVSSSRAGELAQRQMEFAMTVSHELRTPLTVMRLAGDNLAQGVATSPEQVRRYGETIRRESERLAAMVEQVLTFARAQRPDFAVRAQPVQAAQIVDGALVAADAVLREAAFAVVREVDADLPEVNADLNLTIAALTNLLVNAVRHASSGKWVRVRATASAGRVDFEVADHGPGIVRRDLRRIFKPFYRGSKSGNTQGSGLGLHLVRRIAHAHGGTVAVESSPGAGTVITMSLPTVVPSPEEANV